MPYLAAIMFDPTISFGTLIGIAAMVLSIIGTYYAAKQQLAIQLSRFESKLDQHSGTISEHSVRMGQYESEMKSVSNALQRLIGASEAKGRFNSRT